MKGDSWFGSVKAAADIASKGMHSIFQVKTSHSLYPKKFIEDTLADAPGGVHIVLRGKHPNGTTLYALGYKYSSKKALCFIMTDGAGSTIPGTPYEMKFTDDFGNVGKSIVLYKMIVYVITNYTCYYLFLFRGTRSG